MGHIIIDTGTTNTRIRYIEKNIVLGKYSENVGVRDTAITGSLQKLKECIKKGIKSCLKSCNREIEDVDKIIAYGMIISNLGLVDIPHLETPVGLEEICRSVIVKYFKEIVDKPIYFIPGVKNKIGEVESEEFYLMDMMRGEEVETFGALYLTETKGPALYISPGSHTKFVFCDDRKKIVRCSTTLTGELLWALSKETILASSIDNNLMSNLDKEYILKGMEAAKKYGFSRTCFLVRILDILKNTTSNQRVNFIAGAICYYDIKSIEKELKSKELQILIGGKSILRDLYGVVLELNQYDTNKILKLDDKLVEKISFAGPIGIVEGTMSRDGLF